MIITGNSTFTATLVADDPRTGFKTGKTFRPKGVYWNHGDVILVGDKTKGDTVRLAFPAKYVVVQVIPEGKREPRSKP